MIFVLGQSLSLEHTVANMLAILPTALHALFHAGGTMILYTVATGQPRQGSMTHQTNHNNTAPTCPLPSLGAGLALWPILTKKT